MRINPQQAIERLYKGMRKAKGKASSIEFIRTIGDAEESLYVNVSDVMAVVSSVNAKKTSDQTDVNSDGKTDTKDVNAIVNQILGK